MNKDERLYIDCHKENWEVGETAYFEHHPGASDETTLEKTLQAHTRQYVTVLGRAQDDAIPNSTILERREIGQPKVYRVKFEDGYTDEAFEDELLTNEPI